MEQEDNQQLIGRSAKEPMMEVIRVAVTYLIQALKTTKTEIKPKSVRLEEIIGSPETTEWKVTLSYIDATLENAISVLYGGSDNDDRIYKVVTVVVAEENKYTVTSIKDRVK